MPRSIKTNVIRAIDLFSGAGGSSLGAHLAGVEVVAAIDAWDVAAKVHAVNFPAARFYHSRLEELEPTQVLKEIGTIDLLMASPECTNHSPAKGSAPRSEASKNTALQVLRYAQELLPRWVVVENVVNMKKWSRYKEFIDGLKDLGYHVRVQTLNAADFGVAQSRRRLFVMCDRVSPPASVVPLSRRRRAIEPLLDLDGDYRWTPLRREGRAVATLQRAERGFKALGRQKPFLLVYYGSDHAGGWQHLSRPLRTITTVDRFALVRPSKRGHEMRMLQVPELQRAMGMDGLQLAHGTRRDRIKMIGNGVCPSVMTAVVRHLTLRTA